jgi:hypothetical protein
MDKELSRLIGLFKELDCATVNFCEESGGHFTGVQFRTAADARAFLDFVVGLTLEGGPLAANILSTRADSPFEDSLYSRIHGCGSAGDWKFAVRPGAWRSHGAVVDEGRLKGAREVLTFPISVRFPRADVPVILERLTNAVQHISRPGGPIRRPLSYVSWRDVWQEDDLIRFLGDLCKGTLRACLSLSEKRPPTAVLRLQSVIRAGLFLALIVSGPAEGDPDAGCGLGEVGADPDLTDPLYQRVAGTSREEGENWTYEARAMEFAVKEPLVNGVVVPPRSAPWFDFEVTCHLPATDLPVVFERLFEATLGQYQR